MCSEMHIQNACGGWATVAWPLPPCTTAINSRVRFVWQGAVTGSSASKPLFLGAVPTSMHTHEGSHDHAHAAHNLRGRSPGGYRAGVDQSARVRSTHWRRACGQYRCGRCDLLGRPHPDHERCTAPGAGRGRACRAHCGRGHPCRNSTLARRGHPGGGFAGAYFAAWFCGPAQPPGRRGAAGHLGQSAATARWA